MYTVNQSFEQETDGDDDHVEPNPGNPSTQRSRKQTLIKKVSFLITHTSIKLNIFSLDETTGERT